MRRSVAFGEKLRPCASDADRRRSRAGNLGVQVDQYRHPGRNSEPLLSRTAILFEPASGVRAWLSAPANALLVLILGSAALRVAFASVIGLGVDESYMVVGARSLQLSYFDHPPIAWWLTWGAAHLGAGEADVAVRAPFVLLFAVSTWLMYRLGETLFSPRAGLWAAVALNLSPVFGVTTGSWVLPDGPLDCALLAAMLCLTRALASSGWRWWIGVGVCAGLALLSKYTAVLYVAGVGVYLLTQGGDRRSLARWQPYAAALIAAAMFAPVLVWNAEHHWVSFAFQGGRAESLGFHPLAPLVALGGEALFVGPWIWGPLVYCLIAALRRGPSSRGEWLLSCAGLAPIAGFCLVALWSNDQVLFHWAAPGYLMLFPLLGSLISRNLESGERLTRPWLVGSAAAVIVMATLVSTEVRWNWFPAFGTQFAAGKDPALDAVDWTSVRADMTAQLRAHPTAVAVAATGWRDAGKLAYALGPDTPVICLGDDPREFALLHDTGAYAGQDVLILSPDGTLDSVRGEFGGRFDSIDQLPPLTLIRGGRTAMLMGLFLGHHLRPR